MRPPQHQIFVGDVREQLRQFPDGSVQCFCTSLPYWQLRSYGKGAPGQIGLEPTFDEWIEESVAIFRDVRRTLRADGTLFLNCGQSFAGSRSFQGTSAGTDGAFARRANRLGEMSSGSRPEGPVSPKTPEGDDAFARRDVRQGGLGHKLAEGFKSGDLIQQGPLLAEALRRDGWVLRASIIWCKNSLPESVTTRPSINYEFIFQFSKSVKPQFWIHEGGRGTRRKPEPDYVWNDRATKRDLDYEPLGWREKEQFEGRPRFARRNLWEGKSYFYDRDAVREESGANLRAVWFVPNQPFPGKHFAVFPAAIPQLCYKAGASAGGCCPSCAAPRWPLVEEGERDAEWQRECGGDEDGEYDGESTKDHDEEGVQDASAVKARILAGMVRREVKGWFPTCDCPAAEPIPCLVGDPFLGSGRSGRAAMDLGLDFAGVELVPEYAAMAEQNISDPEWEKRERARIKSEKAAAKAAGGTT